MTIIYNKIIPFGRDFYAINLFGIIFAKGPCNMVVRQHEAIHTAQMKEMAYLFFYLAYVIEWLVRIIQYRGYVRRATAVKPMIQHYIASVPAMVTVL